ncbi:hypothetical protein GCM10010341_91520 [Streptomyces noursei]|nr:hypothetical protein GCM10010341_91520 [Streptomyces noursei]
MDHCRTAGLVGAGGKQRTDATHVISAVRDLPRWYLKYEGGAQKVGKLIGIAPSNHGTDLSGLVSLGESLQLMGIAGRFAGQSALDQARDSEVHRRLDDGGDTMPGVEYTTIVTTIDGVLTPHHNQYLTAGPRAKVTNHTIQSHCPNSWTGHATMPFDRTVTQLVDSALDPTNQHIPQCGVLFSHLIGHTLDMRVSLRLVEVVGGVADGGGVGVQQPLERLAGESRLPQFDGHLTVVEHRPAYVTTLVVWGVEPPRVR